jgi:putative endonuclease
VSYCVYLLKCADDTLYCGITNDIKKRLDAHMAGKVKYTRGRLPVRAVCISGCFSRSDALRVEARVKKVPKNSKIDTLMTSDWRKILKNK